MKKVIVFIMLFVLIGHACKKEYSSGTNAEDKKYQVLFELDGEEVSMVYEPEKANSYSMYSFGGVAGNYFGVLSAFKINDKASVTITFGTSLGAGTRLTGSDLARMLAPGKREFGALGSFTSYPRLDSNRVEIAFIDKHSKRWCSTQMMEKQTNYGIETAVKIKQDKSEFIIKEIERVQIDPEMFSYRVSGYFDCFLYEVNGHAKKKMKGNFSGVFCNQE